MKQHIPVHTFTLTDDEICEIIYKNIKFHGRATLCSDLSYFLIRFCFQFLFWFNFYVWFQCLLLLLLRSVTMQTEHFAKPQT